jgi:hypothetical protein
MFLTLLNQSLETAIVGIVLALREALDWVRDSLYAASWRSS